MKQPYTSYLYWSDRPIKVCSTWYVIAKWVLSKMKIMIYYRLTILSILPSKAFWKMSSFKVRREIILKAVGEGGGRVNKAIAVWQVVHTPYLTPSLPDKQNRKLKFPESRFDWPDIWWWSQSQSKMNYISNLPRICWQVGRSRAIKMTNSNSKTWPA